MIKQNNIAILLNYLKPHIGKLVGVFVALIGVAITLLSLGVIFRKFIDIGINAGNAESMRELILIIVSLIIIFAVGSFFRSYLINLIALRVTSKLKLDSYSNLLHLELKKFEELKLGDIITRFSSDIEAVNSLIINFLSFFVRNFFMFIGSVTLMFAESFKLAILTLFCIPIILLPIIFLGKIVKKLSKSVLTHQGEVNSYIEENISGIRTLYAYNRQEYKIDEFRHKINFFNHISRLRLKYRSLFFASAISIIALTIMAIIWIGSVDILAGKLTAGEMISFIYYAIMAGASAGGLIEIISELQMPMASLARVIELKNMPKSDAPQEINEQKIDFNGDIRFENIDFSYPSRPKIQILKNLSLALSHSKFSAIVGKSGAGKSTLLQLLVKFYPVQDGDIKVNSQSINAIEERLIRKKISYVEQSAVIYSGSIRDNILFSNPDSSVEEIDKVIDICAIRQFIESLPDGLDSKIGQKGVRLSGGQKQKIALARALLYKPEILLLDEATSAIDSEDEAKILQNIKQELEGKTIISVAHRISSIEHADEIFVLEKGALVAQGKHKELIKKSETYKLLYKDQLGEQE